MRILVLGGSMFLGRHLVEAALSRGHQVTLFNRGRTNPGLFPNVEKLCGDRDGKLEALKSRRWDAAIDTCGYLPEQVQASAALLADSIDHYTFISSVSVYADASKTGVDETAAAATLPAGVGGHSSDPEYYGANKALCERMAERAMPGRVLIARPGILVGPHDPTNRFAYWVLRSAAGSEVLCPAPPKAPVQIIDARDLAAWLIRMIEVNLTGTFNATGPASKLTMGTMLEECKAATGGAARFIWVDEPFLRGQKVQPGGDLPLWIPESAKDYAGFFAIDGSRAIRAGLVFRPLAETARDVLAFEQPRVNPVCRLAAGREAQILQAWKAGVCA